MLASINWWNYNKRFFCLLVLLSNVIGSYASIVDYEDEHEFESQDQMLRNDHSVDPTDYEQSSRFKHRLHLASLRADNQEDKLLKLEIRLEQECGRYSSQPYISNGRDARPGEFPSYVYIEQLFNNRGPYVCGGTILDSTHILTAAHCNETDPNTSETRVTPYYSKAAASLSNQTVNVKQVCLAAFDVEDIRSPDIAVYELSEPLIFNEYVQSACLPRRPLDCEQPTYVVGRGPTEEGGNTSENLLVWPAKEEKCSFFYDHYTNICFSHATLDYIGGTCPGDSGGGALSIQDGKMRVFGVTSRGKGPCKKGEFTTLSSKNTLVYKKEILELMLQCTSYN